MIILLRILWITIIFSKNVITFIRMKINISVITILN